MKRLLLAGAGHAHLVVLKQLAKSPLYGARITVVAPRATQLYSGMLPGLIAGHYRKDQAEIEVARAAQASHADFVEGSVAKLDAEARRVTLQDGRPLDYDLLCLNVGSRVEHAIRGSETRALAAKPFEAFLAALEQRRPARIAIAGAGAAGMELAMALRFRGAAVTLYSDRRSVSPGLERRASRVMRGMGVDYRQAMAVDAIEEGPVIVGGASRQDFDLVILATGASALPWLQESGLACDTRGFVQVGGTLQSTSHPEVFATGDCASLHGRQERKSGVHSVRQGAALAENLARLFQREPLRAYRSRPRALLLLSCGGKYAIAQRGAWTADGRWVWQWKDWIDRRWVDSFRGKG